MAKIDVLNIVTGAMKARVLFHAYDNTYVETAQFANFEDAVCYAVCANKRICDYLRAEGLEAKEAYSAESL